MSKDKIEKLIEETLSDEEKLKALETILESLPKLSKSIEVLNKMVDSGSLETLANLLCFLNVSKDMLSDEMVSGAASLASSFLDLAAKVNSPHLHALFSAVADHPLELEEEIKKTQITGLFSLMKALRDKDVQKGLSLLIAVTKLIGRHTYPENK